MAKSLHLSTIATGPTERSPPRKLGPHGAKLWCSVQNEYGIADTGGIELLMQACATVDLIETLNAAIAHDGVVVYTGRTPRARPATRDLLIARALLVRTLQRLGITDEVVKPTSGRPPTPTGWTGD